MRAAPLVIAGFHRSGTSLVAQLLNQAGLFVGDDLIGAMPSNPYGHFEDRQFVGVHNRILDENGLTWQVAEPFIPVISPESWQTMQGILDRRRLTRGLWGFKDPRVCLFLEAWRHLLPTMKTLVVFRHYADSAHSLEQRHARELALEIGPAEMHRNFFEKPDLALRMWITHNEYLLAYAASHREDVYVASMESIRGGLPLVEILSERWRYGFTPTHTFSVFDSSATSSRQSAPRIVDPAVAARAEEVLAELRALEADFRRVATT